MWSRRDINFHGGLIRVWTHDLVSTYIGNGSLMRADDYFPLSLFTSHNRSVTNLPAIRKLLAAKFSRRSSLFRYLLVTRAMDVLSEHRFPNDCTKNIDRTSRV